MTQLHYTKAPKNSKYLGKSLMVKEEQDGSVAIMTVIKTVEGKQFWNGINLSIPEMQKVINYLNLKNNGKIA